MYIYIYTHICIYIHTERERERSMTISLFFIGMLNFSLKSHCTNPSARICM